MRRPSPSSDENGSLSVTVGGSRASSRGFKYAASENATVSNSTRLKESRLERGMGFTGCEPRVGDSGKDLICHSPSSARLRCGPGGSGEGIFGRFAVWQADTGSLLVGVSFALAAWQSWHSP